MRRIRRRCCCWISQCEYHTIVLPCHHHIQYVRPEHKRIVLLQLTDLSAAIYYSRIPPIDIPHRTILTVYRTCILLQPLSSCLASTTIYLSIFVRSVDRYCFVLLLYFLMRTHTSIHSASGFIQWRRFFCVRDSSARRTVLRIALNLRPPRTRWSGFIVCIILCDKLISCE